MEDSLIKQSGGMMFYIEEICGGNRNSDAAGGGCGSPRGLTKVSEETFEASDGVLVSDTEHNYDEFLGGQVKLTFSPCSGCRCSY